ncbi:hypothetical protein V6Z12_D11G324900 [Gossypium hirsutum]
MISLPLTDLIPDFLGPLGQSMHLLMFSDKEMVCVSNKLLSWAFG